jgi:hypothetical protein
VRGIKSQRHSFLTPALCGSDWSASVAGRLTSGKSGHVTHWLYPRGGIDRLRNRNICCSCRESKHDSSVVQMRYSGCLRTFLFTYFACSRVYINSVTRCCITRIVDKDSSKMGERNPTYFPVCRTKSWMLTISILSSQAWNAQDKFNFSQFHTNF